jgi:hypothetical protein
MRPLALLLLAGCQDAGLQKHNSVPTATITAPSDAAAFAEGDTVSLVGAVSDPNDDTATLAVTWAVDGATVCAGSAADTAGVTACDIVVGTGAVAVSLQVRDPAGATAVDDITLQASETGAPEVALTSPAEGERLYADQPVLLAAAATDAEDGPEDLRATWTSTLDGDLLVDTALDGDDTTSLFAALTAGSHGLTVVVTDTDGKTGRAQVAVEVGPANSAPSCSIAAPGAGDVVEVGATVELLAYVEDADQPAEELSVSWRSDADGLLGEPTPEASGDVSLSLSTLSAGPHSLTLSVEDEREARCTDTVSIVVGTPPDVEITAPSAGTIFNEGEPVTFAATVSDAQDAAGDLTLSWSSDVDGVLNTDAAPSGSAGFSTSTLAAGAHTVTLTATDTAAQPGSDSVALTINGLPTAPTVGITPDPADTEDALTAAVTVDATDPEGDTLSYAWSWTLGGTATSHTGASVPATDTTRGDVWVATATPNDGRGDGAPGSAAITIGNAAPAVTSATLSPTGPQTNDTINVSVSTSDADGDSVSLSYAWTVDSAAVSATGASLSGTWFSKDQVVGLTVTPSDGTDTGTPVATATVTVLNTPPTAPVVAIDPSETDGTDDLVCTIDVASSDDDGDSITYTIEWEVDGVVYPDASLDSGDTGFAWVGPSTTTWADDTVPADDVVLGEEWTCTATPNDGDDDGPPGSDAVSVGTDPCDGAGASAYAYSQTVEMYGFCWYLGRPSETCDDVCASAGGTNLAVAAESSFADSCSSPSSGDITTWYYNNGNPAGWTRVGGGTNGHGFGYGYSGGTGYGYYGKCVTGTATTLGTYPGESNTNAHRTTVCACFQ